MPHIGGRTMYGALAKAKLRAGDYVVITGAAGGLGHLSVAKLYVSVRSNIIVVGSR